MIGNYEIPGSDAENRGLTKLWGHISLGDIPHRALRVLAYVPYDEDDEENIRGNNFAEIYVYESRPRHFEGTEPELLVAKASVALESVVGWNVGAQCVVLGNEDSDRVGKISNTLENLFEEKPA